MSSGKSILITFGRDGVAQALFVLPFFPLSVTAGQLADKYEKSTPIQEGGL